MTTKARATALRLLAAGGVAVGMMLPATAFAEDTCPYGTGNCGPTDTSGGDPGSNTAGDPDGNGGNLPFTGGDVIGLALIGAGAVAGGTVLVRSGRRRPAQV